jgi:5-methylthioadenosine/S-adenosylhomocysteine deaminase
MRMAIVAARARAQASVLDAATVFGWATEGGVRADLILLDPAAPNLVPVVDGTDIVVHAGNAADVRHVFRDGEHLVADGRPTRIDADAVRRDAQAVADRQWARARTAWRPARAAARGRQAATMSACTPLPRPWPAC